MKIWLEIKWAYLFNLMLVFMLGLYWGARQVFYNYVYKYILLNQIINYWLKDSQTVKLQVLLICELYKLRCPLC